MKITKRIIVTAVFIAFLFLSVSTFHANAEPFVNADNFEISFEFKQTDEGSGEKYHEYYFFANQIADTPLDAGTHLEYQWSFNGELTDFSERHSFSARTSASEEAIHTILLTVGVFSDNAEVERVPLSSATLSEQYYKNGERYYPEPATDDKVPVLSEQNVSIAVEYEVTSQSTGKYYFTLLLKDVAISPKYKLQVDWTFDGDMFTEDETFEMTAGLDPEKSHSLTVTAYVKNVDTNEVVSSVTLPVKYYKDGKVLQNHIDVEPEQPDGRGVLRLIYLPVIAAVLLIVYLIYFRKQNYTGGLDVTIERLSNVLNIASTIDNILNNAKLSEKKKLSQLRLLYKTTRLDVNGTANMLKSYALESNVGVNTNLAVEKLTVAIDALNDVKYKETSAEELSAALYDFLENQIKPTLAVCKQMVVTNNRYLKKHYNDQF